MTDKLENWFQDNGASLAGPEINPSQLQAEYANAKRMAIELFLADPATKDRVSIAVQATLKAISDQNNKRKIVRVGQAAEILTAVILDALSPTSKDINLLTAETAGNG